jgi:xylan 1,4-beta-xylosidase
MTHFTNPILRGFNPDPSIVRVGTDFYIATSTFEWYPGVQIHHSRDLVNWRVATRPLARASQLDLRGVPDSCGVWAPDLTFADGRFYLMYTDVKRYGETTVNGAGGASLRDFHNYLVTAHSIDGPWSEPVHLNSSGFDPAIFHDDDGRSWLLNMLWDHRPDKGRFGGIVAQELDRASLRLLGERKLIFGGTSRYFTEGPHLYKRGGYYHLMVAEGGTGWDHAVVMARSMDLFGPYEVHPDGAVVSAFGNCEAAIARAGHGDLVELADGSPWLVYLCGRPLEGLARCTLGRETSLQPMRWGEDGWLYALTDGALPDLHPPLPLPPAPWPEAAWDGEFSGGVLPSEFQWLRTPEPERLFSLTARSGWLRLFGRETIQSHFEQALIARRFEHHRFTAQTCLDFAPSNFQQSAGIVCYYNSSKFYYLHITCDGESGASRDLHIMSAIPDHGCRDICVVSGLPAGLIELTVAVNQAELRFGWRAAGADAWQWLEPVLDASVLSDEVTLPGRPNFTGSFVGMACQDLSGTALTADFRNFLYSGN